MGLTVEGTAGKTGRRRGKDYMVFTAVSINAQGWHRASPQAMSLWTGVIGNRNPNGIPCFESRKEIMDTG